MITIGQQFPEYELTAVIPGDLCAVDAKAPEDYFTTVSSSDNAGRWKIVFFWPKDFTFVCPTGISAFGMLNAEFEDRDAVVYGVSTDTELAHFARRIQHEDLRILSIPMLAPDARRHEEGARDRANFIIDPTGVVQFAMVTAGSDGRSVDEVLRVLDALQTDELRPCNWRKGIDSTINAGELMKAGV